MTNCPVKAFATLVSVAVIEFSVAAACGAEALPKPTGAYAVGRITVHFVDASRDDDQGTHKDHKREFMAHVWYPAEAGTEGKPAPWMPADWARLEEEAIIGVRLKRSSDPSAKDIPNAIASVVVDAREEAALAASPKRFPVLVFSPGSLMFPSEYSSLVEDLASHGYVVIGNVPTGYVAAVSFPAGNVTRSFKRPNFPLWPGDLIHELDQLEVWNATPEHRFFGRLDLDHVGAFGHSAGGSAVVTIAANDKRVRAIALLDPGMTRPEDGKEIPTLILKSEGLDLARRFPEVTKESAKTRNEYLQKAKPGIQITLVGAEHLSFTDLAVIQAFARPGDGKAFNDTTRAVLLEFFGQYLLGKQHSELIEKGSDKYPLARIDKAG
jgi:pimeloyl-ACP methyl ester carboxylesterase